MKLVIFVVDSADATPLTDALVTAGFFVTRLGSSGGFLRRNSNTLMTGVEDAQVEDVLEIAARLTHARTEFLPVRTLPFLGELDLASEPVQVRRGGAVAWVLPVDRFERL